MKNIIDKFADWFNNSKEYLNDNNLRFTVIRPIGNAPNNSIYIDVDCEKFIGRVTCWESGDCDQEILSAETGETILWKHEFLSNIEDMNAAFENFCKHLLSDAQPD